MSSKLNETTYLLIFFLIKACAKRKLERRVSVSLRPPKDMVKLLDGFQGSTIMCLIKHSLVGNI